MTATPILRLSPPALAGAVIVLWTAACGDDIQGPSGGEATELLSTLIVSDPSLSAHLDGVDVPLNGTSATDGIVFVSLPPGSVPDGERLVVRVRNTGAEATAVMADGGFDPMPVAATAGDTLDVRIERTAGLPLEFISVVPSSRAPMVVRTDPPPKKRDVPLNAQVLVIFSEPIDAATLTASSVRLMLDGVPVVGRLDLVDGMNLAVSFTPAESLAPAAEYTIRITQEIGDLDGEQLAGPVTVTFTTGGPAALARLAIVSGNDQPGKAGRELPEPLVVRVTDAWGDARPGVEVTWRVTAGEGVMDGLWIPCPDYLMSSQELLSHPVPSASVRTDADGLARISFMPTWFGPVTVSASVPGTAVTFSTDASDPEASLEVVPGYADAYEPWVWADGGHYFQPPLAVTVRDGQGDAVPYVRVHWDSEPAGLMSGCPDWWYSDGRATTRTQGEGVVQSKAGLVLATTAFGPGALGPTTVTARVPGVQNSPITFTRNVTTAFIYLASPEGFAGPDRSPDVVVPIGTRVEFPVFSEAAHIVSTSSPPGGVTFDSGPLDRDEILFWYAAAYDPLDPVAPERFGFVPNVAGTWTFVDQISGATGTLTAR